MEIKNNVNKLAPYFNQADLDKLAAQRKGGAPEAASVSGDTVSIASNSLKAVAVQAAQDAPEVRQELVDGIKARVASAEYQIASMDIAAKMLQADAEIF